MKKFIFGLVLFCVGFLGAIVLLASLVVSPESPWIVNGTQGIYSGISFMEMQIPLGSSIVLAGAGLIIAAKEAFPKK